MTEKTTASSWLIALVLCGLVIGAYFIARDYIQASQGGDDAEVAAADDDDPKKKKKRKRKKRRKRSKTGGQEDGYDDYDWSQDFVEDDLVLGDVRSQRDEYVEVEPQQREPEPYNPKPAEYQPNGSYKPTAGWSKPGAKSKVVEIDLNAPSSASPLDESAIKRVLNVRRLAPCYDPWVQKIPQMRGRVHMNFVIDGNGRVISVEITKSQLRSRVVEQCIVDRARGFRFPSASGGAKTRFDTHFDFTNR